MRSLSIALLAAASALAQSVIDYTKLPDCARQCAVLQQAEGSCVPPAAPVTNQATYQSCVCQSTLLTTLHSSGFPCQQNLQGQQICAAADANKISQYYIGLCNGPVVQPSGTTMTTQATTTGTATAAASSGTNAAAGVQPRPTDNYDWFASHWKWVVMVIVIFVAIVFFWVGGIFLRRHYHRKHEAERANMAARDAPYNPPIDPSTPGSNRSALGKEITPPPMTMSGGRSGMAMDGGVGGIAPPRGPPKLRSRSNTLRSLGTGNGSKTSLPPPVVWGPHQHQAYANTNNGNNSPGNSVPPSPTVPVAPPNQVFRNRDAMNSEPRFVHFKATPKDISAQPTDYSPQQGTPGPANWNPSTAGADIIRPDTAPVPAVSENHALNKAQVLNAMPNDPALNPRAEPQSAEFFQATPKKLTKKL
ncbi:hypothetical protein K469DRAFT_260696 [Zopfia rhizophila CBS 207.26]|uniref:Extracellular membrane protein CFEM domain-containing protein n=1 Tax=Zopfia rhizophila CBS 207.26 TaxID=1314779 RepID=A0A6A6DT86_9PEZI|nr:hypothetical protein K469DRAFT_260696 [Zopfia rhizophila CBS 207.26]